MGRLKGVPQKTPLTTDQELERALDLCAKIISKFGDKYWPIYERIETELEQRQTRRTKIQKRLSGHLEGQSPKIDDAQRHD